MYHVKSCSKSFQPVLLLIVECDVVGQYDNFSTLDSSFFIASLNVLTALSASPFKVAPYSFVFRNTVDLG